MNRDRIALKPYLEQIKGFLIPLSKEELIDVVVSLAKDVSTSERTGFMNNIESILPGRSPAHVPDSSRIDEVLNDIQALRESIEERIQSIEDGSYWDDPDDWEDDGYNDEDPDYITDDHVGDMAELFSVAGDLFMDGLLEDARQVYDSLFELVDYIERVTYLPSSEKLDVREARANYSRCIYETTQSEKRLEALAEAMAAFYSSPHGERNLYDEKYPLFQEVIDAREAPMEGLDAFLPTWKEALRRNEQASRSASLLLEAVHLTDGINGVSALARQWKSSQPRGYLFWLDLLKKENKPAEIIRISKEALEALEKGNFRERVAEFLIDASETLKDRDHILLGKRERFHSMCNDQNMLDLVAEATVQNRRNEELDEILRFFETGGDRNEKGILYAKALLMAGRLEDAVSQAKSEKGLGWTRGKAGVVFGAVLWSLAGRSGKTPTIEKLFRTYADQSGIFSGRIILNTGESPTFFQEMTSGLQENERIDKQASQCLPWAEKIGQSRIDGIVSNKHRGAYDRAAEVLGSLVEAYMVMGDEKKALNILRLYYNEKYNRHSAFRREVKSVATDSALLQRCGFL